MKKFFRSIIGKIVLFVTFNLCVLMLTVSVGSAIVRNESDNYTIPETEIRKDVIEERLDYFCVDIINRNVLHNVNTELNCEDFVWYEYEIKNNKDEVVYSGSGGNEEKRSSDFVSYDHDFYLLGDDLYWYSSQEDTSQAHHMHIDAKYNANKNNYQDLVLDFVSFAYASKNYIFVFGAIGLILGFIVIAALIAVAGRSNEDDLLHKSIFFIFPYDLLVLFSGGLLCGLYLLAIEQGNTYSGVIALIVTSIIAVNIVLGLFVELVSRIKQKKLFETTIILRFIGFLIKIIILIPKKILEILRNIFIGIRSYSIVKKVLFILIVLAVGELEIASRSTSTIRRYLLIKNIICIPLILYIVISFKKIKDTTKDVADGSLEQKINTKHMHGDLKAHADNINNISNGMVKALEEKLKSERMKTELITNVSHDIKTPLTSIINYADLIGKEKTSKKVKEYSEVLLRQSNKLKRLTDDLVEVTKANTGNLDVKLENMDITTLFSQVNGEYDEKLKAACLDLVVSLPVESIIIKADGRRMWRVFDNLMNNICKYSQPDTRVYLSSEVKGDDVYIYFKNTSKDSLNITADELKERFVRGETSRNTEGNGLGLSIVESLVELQGGEFKLEIDGDLFKAILKFEIIRDE